jgi:hypothetical protein
MFLVQQKKMKWMSTASSHFTNTYVLLRRAADTFASFDDSVKVTLSQHHHRLHEQ